MTGRDTVEGGSVPDPPLRLPSRGIGREAAVRALLEGVEGLVALAEDLDQYLDVVGFVSAQVDRLRTAADDPAQAALDRLKRNKRLKQIERWRATGWIVSEDGGLLSFAPQFGPDP